MDYQKQLLKVSTFQAWFVVCIISLFFFFEFGLGMAFNVLSNHLSGSYHLNPVALAWITSLYSYSNILFLIPAGMLLDRYSSKHVILIALALVIIGLFMVVFSHKVTILMIARLVMGLGGAFSLIGCVRIASNWFPTEKLGFVIGVIISIGMLGGMVAQTPLQLLVNYFGWRGALACVGWFGVLVWLLIKLFVQNAPKQLQNLYQTRAKEVKQDAILKMLWRAVGKPQNWICGLFVGLINVPTWMLGGLWAKSYLLNVYPHFTEVMVTSITGELFLGMVIAYPLWGALSNFFGRRKPLLIVGAILSLLNVILIIAASAQSSYLEINVLFFLLGVFTSVQTIAYPLVAKINSPKVTSSATSILSMNSLFWGGVIAEPLFPYLMGIHAQSASENYQYAMHLLPIAFIASIICAFLIKEPFKTDV